MKVSRRRLIGSGAGAALLALAVALPVAGQRLVLAQGSVIIVRTSSPLESANAKVGQSFETVVTDSIPIDGYTAIPAGSHIRGVVTFAQPADRQRSGVIEVNFDRLTMPDGRAVSLSGKLTSTDAAER